MEAIYFASFYSICTTVWLSAVGFGIHAMDYATDLDNSKKSNFQLVTQVRWSRFLLLIFLGGACIGLCVPAVANGLTGDILLAQLFAVFIAFVVYKKWVPPLVTEDDYSDAVRHAFILRVKTETIQSVLGILGGMQVNAAGSGSPYRSSTDVLEYLVQHFKSELEKVGK